MESKPSESNFGIDMYLRDQDIYLLPQKSQHKFTLIWLHGLGDTAEGFLEYFYSPVTLIPNNNTKVILLTAPEQAVTINGGDIMNSWYDILKVENDEDGRKKDVDED